MGYTEHSQKHAQNVSVVSSRILSELEFDEEKIEMAKIAGYLHDIGNCINRVNHPHHGAVLARQILKEAGMDYPSIAIVINAIGVHDETSGGAVDEVSAALILADKTDVRRDRVNNQVKSSFDMHDRVNFAVTQSNLKIQKQKKTILFEIELDESICSMMDYFEIFLRRMLMCKKAAEVLGMKFKITANGNKIL